MDIFTSLTSGLPPPKNSQHKSGHISNYFINVEKDLINTFLQNDYNNVANEKKDSILKTAETSNKKYVQSILKPIREKDPSFECKLPTKDEIQKSTAKTRQIVEKILTNIPNVSLNNTTKNIQSNITNLIDIREGEYDPLRPSTKPILKNIPFPEQNMENPETPIVHIPGNSKLSKQDLKNWQIPSAVSEWKNPKGFTISVEKRMDFKKAQLNNLATSVPSTEKFALLSEVLDDATDSARKMLKEKAELKAKETEEEAKKSEIKMRLLAARAQEQRQLNGNNSYSNRREHVRMERRKILEKHQPAIDKNYRGQNYRGQNYRGQNREVLDATNLSVKGEDKSTAKEVQYDSKFFTRGANAEAKRNEEQVYDKPLFNQQNVSRLYKQKRNVHEVYDQDVDEALHNVRTKSIRFSKATKIGMDSSSSIEYKEKGNERKSK
ncbi:uncharacterized protein SCODWIG_02871 [Saccharomycodes ludwigii]|uniref:Pre-mRNA-processing protein 45 n=1 Tax=Saccharomycodes ludwigii TaxID=36035 RepID=A0A376BAF6_9ASCO|nr:hypothetical protein SCDLUD_000463 [Saccharomycodes ludwigii]KAH3902869.1 hypothetical protein SCDLUD_000463 [Saccharomycodes ludwigii]SSD61110.1 uncharacterized protein SCODWIG_02871 [Saccharomycodes ludwigii]